jgi:transcriptional regulator with XRE-family HTH domain
MDTIRTVKIDGRKLTRARESRLLSRQELAYKAGMHVDHLARLERGDIQRPHMPTIRKLVQALDCAPSEILKDEED